jgi:hypothetical protein
MRANVGQVGNLRPIVNRPGPSMVQAIAFRGQSIPPHTAIPEAPAPQTSASSAVRTPPAAQARNPQPRQTSFSPAFSLRLSVSAVKSWPRPVKGGT